MTLTELKKLAEAAQCEVDNLMTIEIGDICHSEVFQAVANPATILAMIALIEQQHEALKHHVEMTRPISQTSAALAAYEEMNK